MLIIYARLRARDAARSAAARGMRTAHARRLARRMHTFDQEDSVVDFNDASLYLPLAQTVFTICACAVVSVLSCWIAPSGAVSAVRTLALCSATGGLLMRTPVRLGKAHGITVVFSALQLAVPLYLGTLVVSQLVHTCSIDARSAPSWRHVVFHGSVLAMVCSGFMRARAPLEDTDRPFIITLLALLVIAMMPPPAVALVGPLCESVTLFEAADRIVRAFCFGMLYCVTVYASTRTRCTNYSYTPTVFFRSASASIWVGGAMIWWLPLAAAQCAIILHARAVHNNAPAAKEYKRVETASSTDEDDIEADLGDLEPKLADPVAEQNRLLSERPIYAEDAHAHHPKLVDLSTPAAQDSPVPVTHEPVGQLAFQQVTLQNDHASESGPDSFEASVAKAMAQEESSH
jgi:hypothetical protein